MFGENAVLLDVSGPSAVDDAYGDPDPLTPGTVVWSGRVPCTLRRRRFVNPNAPPSARIGGSGRSDIQTLVEQDEVIVRLSTGINVPVTPGGRESGYTLLVEDRRNPWQITQQRYTVHSASLRAGGTLADSWSFLLGDGV